MAKSLKKMHPNWSDIQDAAWQTVHQFKHGKKEGAEALSPFVNKSANVISNELNPDQPHKLGLEDAQQYVLLTGDSRILDMFAKNTGYAVIKLPDQDEPLDDISALKAFSRWKAELGKTSESIYTALADNRITEKELNEIETSANQHMGAFFEFLQVLQLMRSGRGN